MLIITDVNWQIDAGNPGTVARLLRLENLANPIFFRNVHNSVLTLNSAGVNGVNENLRAGIAVSSAAKITAHLTVPSGALRAFTLLVPRAGGINVRIGNRTEASASGAGR